MPDSFVVFGFLNCGFYKNAIELLTSLKADKKHLAVNHDDWSITLKEIRKVLKSRDVDNHHTSPLVFVNGNYLGGYDSLVAYVMSSQNKKR